MRKKNYYTPEGLKKLKEELNRLKTKERAEIARQIAEARDKGDLSENAEYDAAKDAQGLLEMKIAQLEEIIANAHVLDENSVNTSRAYILSTVRIKNHKTGREMKYQLVSENEADHKAGKISVQSPIGKALLGKEVGDIVEVDVPAGKLKLEILEITR